MTQPRCIPQVVPDERDPQVKMPLHLGARRGHASERTYGLDILRAAAILLVVYAHGGSLLGVKETGGWYHMFTLDGVSIFFVLSGFLIGSILIRILNRTEFRLGDVCGFWVRRWFRTLPNYFLVLVILVVHAIHYYGWSFADLRLAKYFVFAQNVGGPIVLPFFPESWSLAVEEWFYLLTPLLLFLAIRTGCKQRTAILVAIGIMVLGAMGMRLFHVFQAPDPGIENWDENFRKVVLTRLDAIGFGVFGAFIKWYHPELWLRHRRAFFIAGLCLLALSQLWFLNIQRFGAFEKLLFFTLESVGVLLLLPSCDALKTGKGAFYKFLTFTSLISYSMYLLHFTPVLQTIMVGVGKRMAWCHGVTAYCAYWLVTFLLASFLHLLWEKPMMDLRDKIAFFRNLGHKAPKQPQAKAPSPNSLVA
jgi:peptidoglycan/LPS O-acetylase OafA/YrhL